MRRKRKDEGVIIARSCFLSPSYFLFAPHVSHSNASKRYTDAHIEISKYKVCINSKEPVLHFVNLAISSFFVFVKALKYKYHLAFEWRDKKSNKTRGFPHLPTADRRRRCQELTRLRWLLWYLQLSLLTSMQSLAQLPIIYWTIVKSISQRPHRNA